MDIRTQYVLQNKLSFYQVPKHYEDTSRNKQKNCIINHKVKRLSIFDEVVKIHSNVPGPGKYVINPQSKVKQSNRPRIIQNKEGPKSKQTYLDSLLKRSMSLPQVGKYSIAPDQKIMKYKRVQNKAGIQTFRPTFFDSINRDLINTSPGSYEIRSSLQKSPKYSISPQHKGQQSLPKIPGPLDYNPIPSSYNTFDKKSVSIDNGLRSSTFGVRVEQKRKQQSPGPIYNLISDWGPKRGLENKFNLYKSISVPSKQKVYNVQGR